MSDLFLYQELDSVVRFAGLQAEVPDSVRLNLNPNFELRDYQEDGFRRFIHCYESDFEGKTLPLHYLYNMATGSGKTLIMAGLILFLYEQGYRNFLFFVNSTNIIKKTQENFLNPKSSKYLFNKQVNMDNRIVRIAQVENFEGVNPRDINICFTTIQKLHSDLSTEKENSITYEDFRKHRVVLIADEAHHLNVRTRSDRELFESWENTVENIFHQNDENVLLEFTATLDFGDASIVEKYRQKIIVRYDLVHFRNDGFSKDVVIIKSDYEENERILQALVLSQYKLEVAAKYRLNLKPVILFKAQRTIAQSLETESNFHYLIDNLDAQQLAKIRKSTIPIVQRAFQYFEHHQINDEQLAVRLKQSFHPDFCLSVNREAEKAIYQILLNTLEDTDNRIRAIFAVEKLNEGWDVLNLFDIVRCYETRDSRAGRPGRTTIREAQLIGRGARYFPFVLPDNHDRFRRKYDKDVNHELRVLEELHYHSINDSKYISEIRSALVEQGMMDEQIVERQIFLKDKFKKTDFFKTGLIYVNKQQRKDFSHIFSLEEFGVSKKNFVHSMATGKGDAVAILSNQQQGNSPGDEARVDIKIRDIERNIIQSAIARNTFFRFSSIQRYFPNLSSIKEFIESEKYLGGLEITFQGTSNPFKEDKLGAAVDLLNMLEREVRQTVTEYQGSKTFTQEWVHEVFTDKVLRFSSANTLGNEDTLFDNFVSGKNWFAFNTLYGTSEEKAFVHMLDRQMEELSKKYEAVCLMRNEGHFKIYNFSDGRGFEPDFVLFLRTSGEELLTYQLFIEPKGRHLQEHDRWKEEFLAEITSHFKEKLLGFEDSQKYRIIGVPFYNNEDENIFRSSLAEVLS